jgi:hypothetical protein
LNTFYLLYLIETQDNQMKTLISLLLLCLVSACSSQKLTMHEANIHYADKDVPAVVFVKKGKVKAIVVTGDE